MSLYESTQHYTTLHPQSEDGDIASRHPSTQGNSSERQSNFSQGNPDTKLNPEHDRP